MSKFDTHGGYFAPKDYMKVEEGGSHEENPNGGVQIGVDPEGTPNLLEEGEPVYKDYVYSDNIEADERFLEENNIPKKYAGKLYSKIAEDYVSEAEERPMDPISRSGLEAMLGRLAEAQESQKQAEEQRKLEEELAKLSPEELGQLEAMLAQGQTGEQEMPAEEMMDSAEPMPRQEVVPQMPMMRRGGSLRRNSYPGGGLLDFINNVVSKYTPSTRPGGVAGTYAIDNAFNLGKYKTIEDLEQSEAYDAFTKYIMRNATDPDVLAYLHALDKGTNQANGVPLLFDENDNLVDNWKDLFYERRYDKTPGIYHLNPEEIYMMGPDEPRQQWGPGDETKAPYHGADVNDWYAARAWNTMGMVNPSAATAARTLALNSKGQLAGYPSSDGTFLVEPGGGNSGEQGPGVGRGVNPGGARSYPGLLPTWPRYAGAIGSGLLGLYNVFQQPDKYTDTKMPVFTPEGRINLQNQVYRPIDQNMVANAQIAQGNATQRALRNSGLGPSTAASVLAADNNLTGNLGTGFIQAWDANNQRRNAVIAANNQAEGQRAQFDANMDYYRALMLNNWAARRAQNDLMIQRLNNAAESEKYAAISNQINNGLQDLANIGKENFAMNQINTNPAFLGYGVGPNGGMFYNPVTGRMEPVSASSTASPKPAVSEVQANPTSPMVRAGTNPSQSPLTLYQNPFSLKYSTDPFMGYNNWTLKAKKKK